LPEAPSGRGGHFCITLQGEKQKCGGREHHITQLFKPVIQEKLNMKAKKILKTFFYTLFGYLSEPFNRNLMIFSLLFSELWL
jgi:hypothetical protein